MTDITLRHIRAAADSLRTTATDRRLLREIADILANARAAPADNDEQKPAALLPLLATNPPLTENSPLQPAEIFIFRSYLSAHQNTPQEARNNAVSVWEANPPIPAADTDNALTTVLKAVENQLRRAARKAAMVGKVIADGRGDFQNRQIAENERAATNAMLDFFAGTQPVITSRLRAISENKFAQVIPRLAEVRVVDSPVPLPALIVAHRWFGDTDKADEIAAQHPVPLACQSPFYIQ